MSCPTVWDPIDGSTPGSPVLHYLPEFDSSSCPLIWWCYLTISSFATLFPFAFNIFHWVSPSHQVTKILKLQLLHRSFQWIFRANFFQDWLIWSPCCPRGLSRVFSSTTIWKHQFFGAQPFFMVQLSHLYMTTRKPQLWLYRPLLAKWCLFFVICCLCLS